MGRQEQTIAALDQVFNEAFAAAQERRKSVGLPALKPQLRVIRSGNAKGATRVGLNSYKITLWLQPWFYADLIRAMHRMGLPSVTKTMEKLIEDGLPERQRAPRPQPKEPLAERVGLRRKLRAA